LGLFEAGRLGESLTSSACHTQLSQITNYPEAYMIPEQTFCFILSKVRQHPGIKHSTLLGSDREGAERRREAVELLIAQKQVVRSAKRPWRYSIPQETQQ
jgi:hypothetical protein